MMTHYFQPWSRLLLFLSLCVYLIGASQLSVSDNNVEIVPSYDEVSEAIRVLRSIGVEDLCHPTSMEYDPSLPFCTLESKSEMDESTTKIKRVLEEEIRDLSKEDIIVNSLSALFCITCAALAAGLTMGMLSLEAFDLHIKIRTAASEIEREQASTLVPIVEQRHRLLVTLLLLNALSNEALPLFLDKIVPSYAAVLLSVTFVLFFGEIIPSAVFTGPKQMEIAAMCVPFVKFIMCLFTPLAVPIANLLDYLLGHENKNYDRDELQALVRVNYEERRKHAKAIEAKDRKTTSLTNANLIDFSNGSNNDSVSSIHIDEVTMIEGALHMKTLTASDTMTPIKEVYTLPDNFVLNRENISKVYLSGYSRIPVWDHSATTNKGEAITRLCGILLSKQLMVVDPAQKRTLRSMPLQQPLCVPPQINLVDLLNIFQEGRKSFKTGGHLAVVCKDPKKAILSLEQESYIPKEANVLGIVTLEDVLESLLQEEIRDETDYKEMREVTVARKTVDRWRKFMIEKKLARGEDLHGNFSFSTLISSIKSQKIHEHAPLLTSNDNIPKYGEP